MGQEDVTGPPKKKLKQGRLSFANAQMKNNNVNKRKLSEDLGDNGSKSTKLVCLENSAAPLKVKSIHNISKCEETIVLSDDNTEDGENCDTNVGDAKTGNNETLGTIRDEGGSPTTDHDSELKDEKLPNELNETESPEENLEINKIENLKKEGDSHSEPSKDETALQNVEVVSLQKNDAREEDCETGRESEDKEIDCSVDLDTSHKSNSDKDTDMESETPPKTPSNKSPSTNPRKLTPKQLQKKKEVQKRKEERLSRKMEKEKERAQRKEEKLKIRSEKELEKKREKEEKERKRKAEMQQKEEEKRQKEDERKKKEEDRRKKEEEKKKKDEEKRKKEEAKEEIKKKKEEEKNRLESQARAVFANFFVAKKGSGTEDRPEDSKEEIASTIFMPFQVKNEMRLAEVSRSCLTEEGRVKLDKILENNFDSEREQLYIKELKSGEHKPKTSEATWPLSSWEEQHDVIVIESVGEEMRVEPNDQVGSKLKYNKAKLLQFHDNRRPPYWGTWRKKSKLVTPRRPLGKDMVAFDYEVDSDSEWEDEEEGESLEDGEEADKEQSEDEDVGENGYLLDNTFVPHGYLSDEEARAKDENVSPEEQKLRMVMLKEEFDEEMNQKAQRLKPRLLGCVWISNDTTEVSKGSLYETLLMYRCVWDEASGPIDLTAPQEVESPLSTPTPSSKLKPFPSAVVEPLVKLVHGSHLPLSQLVKEFLAQLEKENPAHCITKHAVTRKIKDIARRSYDGAGRQLWSVSDVCCEEFGLKNLTSPKPAEKAPVEGSEKPKDTFLDTFLKTPRPNQPPKKRVPLISLPPIKPPGNTPTSKNSPSPLVKKRVALITLPRTPEHKKVPLFVHKDTPRPPPQPLNNPEQPSDVIDLSD